MDREGTGPTVELVRDPRGRVVRQSVADSSTEFEYDETTLVGTGGTVAFWIIDPDANQGEQACGPDRDVLRHAERGGPR